MRTTEGGPVDRGTSFGLCPGSGGLSDLGEERPTRGKLKNSIKMRKIRRGKFENDEPLHFRRTLFTGVYLGYVGQGLIGLVVQIRHPCHLHDGVKLVKRMPDVLFGYLFRYLRDEDGERLLRAARDRDLKMEKQMKILPDAFALLPLLPPDDPRTIPFCKISHRWLCENPSWTPPDNLPDLQIWIRCLSPS